MIPQLEGTFAAINVNAMRNDRTEPAGVLLNFLPHPDGFCYLFSMFTEFLNEIAESRL